MNTTQTSKNTNSKRIQKAELVKELTIEGVDRIHGVSFDGKNVWLADGTRGGLVAVDETGKAVERLADVPAEAGTACDGQHLYQVADDRIQKIDRKTGKILKSIPGPSKGNNSGLTWAAGALWVGDYKGRRIHKIDPETGAILKTLESDRFVTGVTWVDEQLWHGVNESGEAGIRRLAPKSGAVLVELRMPEGVGVSGVEADDKHRLWFGDASTGKLRAAARPVD